MFLSLCTHVSVEFIQPHSPWHCTRTWAHITYMHTHIHMYVQWLNVPWYFLNFFYFLPLMHVSVCVCACLSAVAMQGPTCCWWWISHKRGCLVSTYLLCASFSVVCWAQWPNVSAFMQLSVSFISQACAHFRVRPSQLHMCYLSWTVLLQEDITVQWNVWVCVCVRMFSV